MVKNQRGNQESLRRVQELYSRQVLGKGWNYLGVPKSFHDHKSSDLHV